MKTVEPKRADWQRTDVFTVIALIVAVAVVLFPFVRSTFIPFVDLPQHVALAQLLRHIDNPDVSRLYAADLFPQVNILALLLMSSLFAVVPEGAAVILVLLAYVAGLAYGMTRLSSALELRWGNAVIALIFAVNFNLVYGFMSFCLGVPVLMLIAARLADARETWRLRAALADAALWIILVFAHALLFVFALAAALLWLALAPLAFGARFRRVTAAVPALIPALGWYFFGGGGGEAGLGSKVAFEWHGLAQRFAGVGWSTIASGVGGVFGWIVLGLAGGLVAALLALEIRRQKSRGGGTGRRTGRMRLWVRLVALLAAVLYFCLPYAIVSAQLVTRGVFLFYNRFAALAPMFLIATLQWPTSGKLRHLALSMAVLLNVALAWHWTGMLARVSGEARGMDGAIESMKRGGIVKSLIYTPYSDAVDFPVFLHSGSYYQARKLGESDQSFALLPSTPVHYRDPLRPYLSQRDEHLAPHMFDWSKARLYDYILIYDRGAEWRPVYSRAPFARIYEQNGWTVLEVGDRRR